MNNQDIKKKKIDFLKTYFHGLDFRSAENPNYLEKMVLESILKHGKIMPRSELKKFLTNEQYSLLISSRFSQNWNGDDFVSVATTKSTYNSWSKSCVCADDNAFSLFCRFNISIMISPKIFWDYHCFGHGVINRESHYMNGEIQVEGGIYKDCFEGISFLPYLNSDIEQILKESKVSGMKEDLFNLTEEEFVKKYFSQQIMIEELLQKYGYSLDIFNIYTGEQAPSIEEEKEFIYTMKCKYM